MKFQAHSGSRLKPTGERGASPLAKSALADLGYQPEIYFKAGEPENDAFALKWNFRLTAEVGSSRLEDAAPLRWPVRFSGLGLSA
jgi:hypothetical protein